MSRPHAFNEYRFRLPIPAVPGTRRPPCTIEGSISTSLAAVRWYGSGGYGDRVAAAVAESHPGRSLAIYRQGVDDHLPHANASAYEAVADYLRKMRPIFQGLHRNSEWDGLLADIRLRYKTGPSSWRFSTDWTQGQLWNRQEFGDSSWEMFARMYERRRKGYASIGYERVPPQIPVEVENNNATEPHRSSAMSEG